MHLFLMFVDCSLIACFEWTYFTLIRLIPSVCISRREQKSIVINRNDKQYDVVLPVRVKTCFLTKRLIAVCTFKWFKIFMNRFFVSY